MGRIGSGVRISASFNQIFRRILSCGSQKGGYDIEGWPPTQPLCWAYGGNTGWLIKTPPIFCLRKDTCSKPRQNCSDNWIEHCLQYSYLSRQLRRLRRHWEILDEVGTLVKSIFHQSGCAVRDPDFRKKSWYISVWISWNGIFWSTENKSWPELLHWSAEDLLNAWMSSTLSGQWLSVFTQDSAPSHPAKTTQRFPRHYRTFQTS